MMMKNEKKLWCTCTRGMSKRDPVLLGNQRHVLPWHPHDTTTVIGCVSLCATRYLAETNYFTREAILFYGIPMRKLLYFADQH